jgi:iron complex transport system substrate-binding protein
LPLDPTAFSRRALLRASLASLPALLAACSRRGARGSVHRVVTLGPNATEILFALGRGETVVGVSRYDDYPPEAARLPRVGGLLDPSFEAIVALRPDAVIGARGPLNRAVLDRIEALGVRALFPPVESLDEVRAAVHAFADLVGSPERAAPLVARIDAQIDAVRARVRGRASPSVLAVLGQRPISVAGPGSFLDALIGIAGGRNVVRTGPRWPSLSLETVLMLAPEVVLDLTSMEGHSALRDAWSGYDAIPAVRDGRVVALTDPVVLRPGPRAGEAALVVARAIHPGL